MVEKRSGKEKRYLVLDCLEQIPCNPCEEVCRRGALTVGENINDVPVLSAEKCDGCGICINACPGSCIFLVEETGEGRALVTMAYDRLPRPAEGSEVTLVGSCGEAIGQGIVRRLKNTRTDRNLWQVTVETSAGLAGAVRGFRAGEAAQAVRPREVEPPAREISLLCRCEEVAYPELDKVISVGVRRAANLRRFTRAGLGLCQGKACNELLLNRLSDLSGLGTEELGLPRARPPVRPVRLGELGG